MEKKETPQQAFAQFVRGIALAAAIVQAGAAMKPTHPVRQN